MPKAYKTPEYDHLLIAERALVARITKDSIEDKDLAACARVLVAVLDYKRVMRMKPKPKDMDVSKAQQRQRHAPAADATPAFAAPPTKQAA